MIASERMKHFIVTPFYVRRHFTGHADAQIASPAWLDDRMQLFERYCLPSVIGQSAQSFEWLLYLDQSTPQHYLRSLESLTVKSANISIILCAMWEPKAIVKEVVARQPAGTEWIITSRLDNDDGLHRDFVATLQSAAEERIEYLNFPCGIILYGGKCFLYKHPSNAFISHVEPADSPRTVWTIAHERAAEIAPVRQLAPTPAFLQVVHGKNVSNKPRGMRIAPKRALEGFEAIQVLKTLSFREAPLGVMFENATRGMMWKLRDALISLAKAVRR